MSQLNNELHLISQIWLTKKKKKIQDYKIWFMIYVSI